MMKRTFAYQALMALLLATAFAGCQREVLPSTGDPISFSVGTKTKVDDNLTTFDYLLKNGNQITVWAERIVGGTHYNVFDGPQPTTVQCKQVGNDFTWDYTGGDASKIKYWETTGTYKFRSVFPTTADIQSNTSCDKLVIDYSMHESNYDLLVAAKNFDARPSDNLVPLQFRHANAAVRFRFKTVTQDIYLTGFSLQNVYTLGTLNYSGDGTTGVSMNEWTLHDTRAPQVFPWTGEAKSSSLVFVADLTPGSEKVTVTTSGEAPGPIDEASVWLEFGDGKRVGMTPDSDDPTDPASSIYRVKVVDFVSTWGFHFLVGNRVWGGNGILLSLGEDYPIAKNGNDINFAYRSGFTSYWTVPTDVYEGFGCYYVIPQNLNIDDGLRPAVTFTYALGQMSIPTTLPLPVVNNDTSIKWEAGKVYVYNIQIQPETTITVSVEDWESFYVTTDDLIFTDD